MQQHELLNLTGGLTVHWDVTFQVCGINCDKGLSAVQSYKDKRPWRQLWSRLSVLHSLCQAE
jgi:hypothetical protein